MKDLFQTGAIVTLRSGGPKMTVVGLPAAHLGCVTVGYFTTTNVYQEATIPKAALFPLPCSLTDTLITEDPTR